MKAHLLRNAPGGRWTLCGKHLAYSAVIGGYCYIGKQDRPAPLAVADDSEQATCAPCRRRAEQIAAEREQAREALP